MIQGFQIAAREIGPGMPAYIIAEAGVNHNGDLKIALELVRRAKLAGADCVKFQTFKAESIVTKSAPKANYQLQVTDPKESQLEMLKKLELGEEHYREIMGLCRDLGIQFLSTPYNFEDVDFLSALHVDAFKIASGQIAELPFLEYVASTGKPLIISTGMATRDEVREAVATIRSAGNERFAILQCTTNYPSRIEDANLRAMVTMRDEFSVVAGYSDHTETDHAVFASVALGAMVIERHFTLDRTMPGPDHSSSLEPQEFSAMVKGIRQIEAALGSSLKAPTEAEKRNSAGMRRSIVSLVEIPAGAIITREKIAFKRPATGLKPNLLPKVVGKKAKKTIPSDSPLTEDQIEW